MSAATAADPDPTTPKTDVPLPGGVRVHERVLGKIARQASAAAVGVTRDDVHAEVVEWGGGLAVRLSTKLPIPDLADAEAIRSGPPIIERVRAVQVALADDLERITGRKIRRVSVTINGAIVAERKRVR